MRDRFLCLLAVFFVLSGFLSTVSAAEGSSSSAYSLGASDVLEISVWNRPDLKRQLIVRPDGWITYPLIGEVRVNGVTPAELTARITRRLAKYVRNPVVSVDVLQYRSSKILVIGEVKTPGLYQCEGNMTVFNAIGLAGGYNKYAELKNVLVVRNATYKPKNPDFFIVNIHKLIHDGNVLGNIALLPGDIVYVPKNIVGNIGAAVDYYLSRISSIAQSYGYVRSNTY